MSIKDKSVKAGTGTYKCRVFSGKLVTVQPVSLKMEGKINFFGNNTDTPTYTVNMEKKNYLLLRIHRLNIQGIHKDDMTFAGNCTSFNGI